MNKELFYKELNKALLENHIMVSEVNLSKEETISYIIEDNGVVSAYLEGNDVYNIEMIGLLNIDAYPKILKFVKELGLLPNASTYITVSIKENNNREEYHLSTDSFERFIVTMQDAIRAGINLLEMNDDDKIKLINKISKRIGT